MNRGWTDELTAVCIKPVQLWSQIVLLQNVERLWSESMQVHTALPEPH